MSGPLGSSQWMYATDSSFYGYSINQSLRFDGSSSYLNFTPSNTATDSSKITFSTWVKTWGVGISDGYILSAGSSYIDGFAYNSNNQFTSIRNGGTGGGSATASGKIRDVSAWYHLYIIYDADAGYNRIYINGELRGENSTSNDLARLGVNGQVHRIVRKSNANTYLDLYLAETHFVDGSIVPISTFAEDKNGVWVPVETSGITYGNNGWYLNYADGSDIGKDVSGRGNHWTANNLAASDVVSDTPTNSFCTLNPLTHGTWPTLKEGNLSIKGVYSADLCGVTSTWFPTTGKWYWEIHAEGSTLTYPYFGITDQRQVLTNTTKGSFYSVAWGRAGTSVAMTGTNTYMGTITKENATSWTNNDIIMFALDVDARKLWIGKNGTWNDSGDPAAGTGENASWTVDTGVSPSFMGYNSQGVNSVFNFGQDGTFNGNQTAQGNADDNGVGDFYYSPPSGFLAMATSNIAEPTIGPGKNEQADDNFNTVLYTGDGSNGQAITGVGFQPDWLWVKARSTTAYHEIHDSVRGAGTRLFPHETNDESTVGTVSSFDTDGFTVSRNSAYDGTNQNTKTFVGWSWKAGGSASSNSNGSITSNVSANPAAGFSIVSYTGNATDGATVGHGLSETVEAVIVKRRDNTAHWQYLDKNLTSGKVLLLSSTGSESSYSSFTGGGIDNLGSTTFSLEDGSSNGDNVNASGDTYIAYCFHSVEGYSKIGQYKGNSGANGTFVYLGFRPAWVLIKSKGSGTDWCIFDNKRQGYNVDNDLLRVAAATEQTDDDVDFLSNGLKFRRSSTNFNNSSHTYIYLAFADDPFKYANAR